MNVRCYHKRPLKPSAFTIVELLVVIGIIAMLIAMLLPSLSRVRQAGFKIKCASQLRQIGVALQLYVNTYHGAMSASKSGTNWLATNSSGQLALIDPQGSRAYWGVAYAPFVIPRAVLAATGGEAVVIKQAAYGIWHCPSSQFNDQTLHLAPEEPVSYGVNALITGSIPPKWRRITHYKQTSQIVFAQDSFKSVMNNNAQDTLSDFGTGTNLADYRVGGVYYSIVQSGITEYFRHMRRSNVLWLDGHVSSIAESLGTDVPSRWYKPPETTMP